MKLLGLSDLSRGPGRHLLDATVAQGFSEPVARAGLSAELAAWTTPGALDAVRAELPVGLEPGRLPRCVLVFGARTLPVSAMRAVLMARIVGARVLLKAASGRDALAEVLAEVDPQVEARPFGSDDEAALTHAVAEADAVVVLGSNETLRAVRVVVPRDKAFVGYGHRVSAAWLGRADEADIEGLARDVIAWDQAGCLSPQVAWVHGDPTAHAKRLADAIRTQERTMPMVLPAGAGPDRHTARTFAEMTGVACETETALVAALSEPTFRASPGYRCVWVLPAEPRALAAVVPSLSTLGVSGRAPDGLPSSVRICGLGEMQRPPLTWRHDGEANLLPMLRPTR